MIFKEHIQKIAKQERNYILTFWFVGQAIYGEMYSYILFENDCTIYSGTEYFNDLTEKIKLCKLVFKKFKLYETFGHLTNYAKSELIKI